MTDEAARDWEVLSQDFARFFVKLSRVTTTHVNSPELRAEANDLSLRYLRTTRSHLNAAGLNDEARVLDSAFEALLQLSDGNNNVSSYKKSANLIRKAGPKIRALLAKSAGAARSGGLSLDEKRLIETLGALVPTAAVSYQQALADLSDSNRMSFRGPALELREALREVLDHLAPDKDVSEADGFQLEKGLTKQTMKQKVRFILKARGKGKTTIGPPEDSVNRIEGLVADVTRSVADLSSIATHVATEKQNVVSVKRYIDAVLHDILEL